MVERSFAFWRLIAALTLAVGLLHAVALAWLSSLWQTPSVLRAVATPMFTRVLSASAPPVPPPRSSLPARAVRRSPTPATPSPASPLPQAALPPGAASDTVALAEPEPAPPEPPQPPSQDANPAVPKPPASAAQTPQPPASSPALPPPPDTWPPATRLRYVVGGYYRGELHGNAHVQWQREGDRYQVQLEVRIGWLAHLTMTSQGRVTANELRPEAFEELNGSRRRHVTVTPQDLVLMNGTRVPRPEGVQDTASQFVEFVHRFATASTPLAVGQTVTLWLARPGGVDQWTYDVTEQETLHTPRHGAVETFHLKPRPLAKPRGPVTAEMWFAPTLQYLPVRIRINLNETTWVDLMVDQIEQSEPPGPP